MPKIRTKQIYKLGDGQYIKKSGCLTRSLKNIVKKERSYKSFFKDSYYHNRDGREINTVPYDDNKTILYIEKNVNNTFPVEDSYKLNNKILHSPNEFDTSSKINKTVSARIYNMFVKENYVQEQHEAFNDSSVANKVDLTGNKEEIRINLKFSDPCRLSFNKDSNSNQTVNLNNTDYNCINSPMVYFNFNEEKWDYLGDINKNYYETRSDFADAPLAFNSISPVKSNKVSNQTLGYPINTFGFPFDDRYQGLSRHALKISKYITKPFLLENIKIRFKGTSRAETESNFNLSILNSLNFFIINQRKNLNKNSFVNLGLNTGSFEYFTIGEGYQHNTESLSYSVDNFPIYTQMDKTNTTGETSLLLNSSNSNPTYEELSSSQRELITCLNIVNFSSGGANEASINIDVDSIRRNADFIREDLSVSSDSTLFANCNYDDKVIEVSGSVRTSTYHEKLESFGKFNIYPESTYINRTGTEYNTERSERSDFTTKDSIETSIDDAGKSLSISKSSYKENPYLLLPTDEILIGFSFNPNMRPSSNNKTGKDIYILKDNVEISLIGRYYQKDFKTKTSNITFKNNFHKRINYFEQKNNPDSVAMNNIYLNKGAYYDSKLGPFQVGLNTIVFVNMDSSAMADTISGLRGTAKTFTSFKKVKDENEENIDLLVGGAKDYSSQYLSYFKFGQTKDRLNSNKFSSFKDLLLNKTYYTVHKRFRNSLTLEEITLTSSSTTTNKDLRARLVLDSSDPYYDANSTSFFKE